MTNGAYVLRWKSEKSSHSSVSYTLAATRDMDSPTLHVDVGNEAVSGKQAAYGRPIDWDEIARHATALDCWVVVYGEVLDVTNFAQHHPGGMTALVSKGRAGTDVTSHFERIGHSVMAQETLKSMRIGHLSEASVIEPALREVESQQQSNPEDDYIPQDSHPVQAEDLPAAKWHQKRRAAILKAHPEVANLAGTQPLTLLVGASSSPIRNPDRPSCHDLNPYPNLTQP